MTARAMDLLVKVSICLALVSCKSPVSFTALDTASAAKVTDETSTETVSSESDALSDDDQQMVDSICSHADSDCKNAFEGDVMQKPFLEISFPMASGIQPTNQKCVKVTILDDSDTKRELLYTYTCRQVEGTVHFTAEAIDTSVISKIETDVEVFNPHHPSRHLKSFNTHERAEDGSLHIDKEFFESYMMGEEAHQITGLSLYDFAAEKVEDADGKEVIVPNKGYVQITANVVHAKNNVTQSLRSISSEGLHRSACGFDEGSITVKEADKSIVISYTACSKKTVKIQEAKAAE